MTEPPAAIAGTPPAPLGPIAAGGLGRVGLAGLVLVLAAAAVTVSGGAGLGGRLGSLFGFNSKPSREPVHAVDAAAPVSSTPYVAETRPALPQVQRRTPPARSHKRSEPVRSTPRRSPSPTDRPAPPKAPALPPVSLPAPPGAPSGTVDRAVKAVQETTAPVPAAQPVVDQLTSAVGQACGLLGGCP